MTKPVFGEMAHTQLKNDFQTWLNDEGKIIKKKNPQ